VEVEEHKYGSSDFCACGNAHISLPTSMLTSYLHNACALTSLLPQTRTWNKELEARPSDLHAFARLKQRHHVMETGKGELFKVSCVCICVSVYMYWFKYKVLCVDLCVPVCMFW